MPAVWMMWEGLHLTCALQFWNISQFRLHISAKAFLVPTLWKVKIWLPLEYMLKNVLSSSDPFNEAIIKVDVAIAAYGASLQDLGMMTAVQICTTVEETLNGVREIKQRVENLTLGQPLYSTSQVSLTVLIASRSTHSGESLDPYDRRRGNTVNRIEIC